MKIAETLLVTVDDVAIFGSNHDDIWRALLGLEVKPGGVYSFSAPEFRIKDEDWGGEGIEIFRKKKP